MGIRDSSVSLVTRVRAGKLRDRGSISIRVWRQILGSSDPPIHGIPRPRSMEVKQPRHAAVPPLRPHALLVCTGTLPLPSYMSPIVTLPQSMRETKMHGLQNFSRKLE